MKFEIDKDTAEKLVSVIDDWAVKHSILECTGNKAIIFKHQVLEEALKNWEDEE